VAEDQGKEEEKFDFTPEGEGYISLDEARVLAMRTAVETPGDYGSQYQGVAMFFEVASLEETDDFYEVTLSFRPQGNFDGTPGQEQFVVGKEGAISIRQVQSFPAQTLASQADTPRKSGGFPILPVAIGLVVVGIIAAISAVVALGGSGGDSVPIAAVPRIETSAPTAAPTSTDPDGPIISSEQQAAGPDYSGIIVTTDMSVGVNRIVFGVINREGMPVPGTISTVSAYFHVPMQDTRELKDSATAEFVSWPTTVGGVFVADLDLDIAGAYELDINFTANDSTPIFAQASFLVEEEPSTPAIGSPAPASVTHTAAGTNDISHITTSPVPDLDLYELSIHEALQQDKPVVIVFATPAFCVSATCGPQVGELTKVKESVGDRANYIHVEVFEEPHMIEGQRPTGGLVPAIDEWGLPTEPWTFIIDSQGLVRAKFEQFTTAGEIETKLLEIL